MNYAAMKAAGGAAAEGGVARLSSVHWLPSGRLVVVVVVAAVVVVALAAGWQQHPTCAFSEAKVRAGDFVAPLGVAQNCFLVLWGGIGQS